MEMWQKIIWAVFLGMMAIFIFPRARAMLNESAKVKNKDWMGVVLPILAVILFVIFLIMMV